MCIFYCLRINLPIKMGHCCTKWPVQHQEILTITQWFNLSDTLKLSVCWKSLETKNIHIASDQYHGDLVQTFGNYDTVKPVYNDHLMGYFSAFWSSSRWSGSSRRQKLLARVNGYLQSSLKRITELITGNKSYYRAGRYRQVSLYQLSLPG